MRPSTRRTPDVSHPELYEAFMYLPARSPEHGLGPVIINALSERLVVSTIHDGQRYRASFRHGGLVSLLGKHTLTEEPYGTNWITFKPEAAIAPGTVTPDHARRIVERVAAGAPGVDVSLVDRSSERPDWW
jgi:DNA gyrase/topoisomerase IV subunit B